MTGPERREVAAVRPVDGGDLPALAALFAERQGIAADAARAEVGRWLDPAIGTVVFVAAWEGQVRGYGKANRLDGDPTVASRPAGTCPVSWSTRRHDGAAWETC